MKLTVIIPVYNEATTLQTLLDRVLAAPSDKEVLIVDDGSDLETKNLLATIAEDEAYQAVRLFTHAQNQGKGAGICTALQQATGDVVIIQDADLEYYPEDYQDLLDVYQKQQVDVVYGVRDLSQRSLLMKLGNYGMTWATNILFGSRLHDMETCYKLIDRELMQSLDLGSRGFEVEAEITAKLLQKGIRIAETPIRYDHREEGKKLTPLDGIPTLGTLIKFRLQRPDNTLDYLFLAVMAGLLIVIGLIVGLLLANVGRR
ncbi:MAG: glycosyltransferase family 2 protein [Chloroflexota bacterium]